MGGVVEPDFGKIKAPKAALAVLRKMVATDRTQRYGTYPELINALAPFHK